MIGERLKDLRDEHQLKQSDLAKLLGVSRAHCSHWENESKLIPLKKLNDICNHFNVSMDYMIGLTRNNQGNGIHELNSKVIGDHLKKFRNDRNITQVELANVLNTTHSTISAYESGKTILLTAFALQIVQTYDISLDWLCGRVK